MAEAQLNLHEILAQLPAPVTPLAAPPELWSRIAATHVARRQRRRMWRIGAASCAVLALALCWALLRTSKPAAINWQARAQALELQLDDLPLPSAVDSMGLLAEGELAHLDQSLQVAYDRGAQADEISPLWQRRSELLETLLALRRQQFRSSRI